jgi:hypothetical protein
MDLIDPFESSDPPAPSDPSELADIAEASDERCRIAWIPSHIRYSAPASLTTRKTSADRSSSVPRPTATNAATT